MNSEQAVSGRESSNEIDLLELFQSLWKQKWLILLITLLVTLGAASYAFLSAPVYQARSTVLPPRLSDIAAYNLGRMEAALNDFTVADVYAVFTKNLTTESLRRDFFRAVYLPALESESGGIAQDQLWKRFNKELVIRAPDAKNNPALLEVSVEHKSPQQAAEWANLMVRMAVKKTKKDMQDTVRAEASTRMQSIQKNIKILRGSARKKREDHIVRLREALIVAEAVGLDAPKVSANRISSGSQLAEFMNGNLLYMSGAKAVRAELDVLERREDDDPFITELRGLENKLDFLENIDIDPENVSVVTIDGVAEVPQTSIKPKKILILALGLVLGGMLGLFIALIRSMLAKSSVKTA